MAGEDQLGTSPRNIHFKLVNFDAPNLIVQSTMEPKKVKRYVTKTQSHTSQVKSVYEIPQRQPTKRKHSDFQLCDFEGLLNLSKLTLNEKTLKREDQRPQDEQSASKKTSSFKIFNFDKLDMGILNQSEEQQKQIEKNIRNVIEIGANKRQSTKQGFTPTDTDDMDIDQQKPPLKKNRHENSVSIFSLLPPELKLHIIRLSFHHDILLAKPDFYNESYPYTPRLYQEIIEDITRFITLLTISKGVKMHLSGKMGNFIECYQHLYADKVFNDLYKNQLILPNVLRNIDIKKKELTKIPRQIFSLINLTDLNLSGNKISYLPPIIENLKNLKKWDLSNNSLIEIPDYIKKLRGLEKLFLEGNDSLVSLPIDSLHQMKSLNLLDLLNCHKLDNKTKEGIQVLQDTTNISVRNWGSLPRGRIIRIQTSNNIH